MSAAVTAAPLPRIAPRGHNGGMVLNILHIATPRDDAQAAVAEAHAAGLLVFPRLVIRGQPARLTVKQ